MKNAKNRILIALCFILASITAFLCVSCSDPSDNDLPETPEKLQVPQNLTAEGLVVTWDAVENATGYIVNFQHTEYEVDECRFDLYFYDEPGTYKFEVMALGDGKAYEDSEWIDISVTIYEKVVEGYDELGFKYKLLDDGTGYEVSQGKANLTGVITIPDYFGNYPVKRIAEYAFSSKSIEKSCFTEENCNKVTTGINLPSHLESIGIHAFACMIRLEEIVIPDSVVEIGHSAFLGNKAMKRVVLPKGLKKIPGSCFQHTALSEISLPDSLEYIGPRAFACTYSSRGIDSLPPNHINSDLSIVVIPDSVVEIGDAAFRGRENLKTVILSDNNSLEYFDYNVFYETLWYESQADGPVYLANILYKYKGEMPENYEIELPENLKAIAGAAFDGQKNLKKITIPRGVKLIGSQILYGCVSLTEVILPEDLYSIPDNCFGNTQNLRSISLPNSLSSIGDAAFTRSGLKSIFIPEGVKEIGFHAFLGCTELSEVHLPDSLEIIEKGAFRECTALTEISLPKALKTIDDLAFAYSAPESAILPKSLEYIGLNLFRSCDNLVSIYYEGNAEEWTNLISKNRLLEKNLAAGGFSNVPIYIYSETQPTEEGNFWHYVDGKPTLWFEKKQIEQ